MDTYRNIRRSFLYHKGLRKYNKMNKTQLKKSCIDLLYACELLGGSDSFVQISRIFQVFRKINLEKKIWHLDTMVKDMTKEGYLIRVSDPEKADVKLSVDGIIVLKTFEETLREERWDR